MTHIADFTRREIELLDLVLEDIEEFGYSPGLPDRVAQRLGLSPVTVRTRLSRLRSKYAGTLRFIKVYRRYQQKIFQKSGGKFNPLSVSGRPVKK